MNHQRVFALLFGVVVWSGVARAQEPGLPGAVPQPIDDREGLGLEAAISLAVTREPSLLAVRADIEVARGQQHQAGLRPNPTLSVERRIEPGATDNLTTVGIEWPLDLSRRSGRVQTADRSLSVAQLAAEDQERVLIANVRLQYGAATAAARANRN